MKKSVRIVVTLTLILAILLPSRMMASAGIKEQMRSYKAKPGIEYLHVNSFLLWIAGAFVDDNNLRAIVRDLKSVTILSAEEASQGLRERVVESVKRGMGHKYELLMESKAEGEEIGIWGRLDGKFIKSVVIVEGSEAAIILLDIKGRGLTMEEIGRIMAQLKD